MSKRLSATCHGSLLPEGCYKGGGSALCGTGLFFIAFQRQGEHVPFAGTGREPGDRQREATARFIIKDQDRDAFFDPVDGGSHGLTAPTSLSMIVPAPSRRMATSPLFPKIGEDCPMKMAVSFMVPLPV